MRSKLYFAGVGLVIASLSFALLGAAVGGPINPKANKGKFDEAKKDAELVAEVRVLSAVCPEAAGDGKAKSVPLQLALKVLKTKKGPAKKNDVLIVSHKVNLPS